MSIPQAHPSEPAGRPAPPTSPPPGAPATISAKKRSAAYKAIDRPKRLAEIETELARIEPRVAKLRQERKALKASIRMSYRCENDEEFMFKFRARRRAIPGTIEYGEWRERISAACKRLPDMTRAQSKHYRKLRYDNGWAREAALAEALKA